MSGSTIFAAIRRTSPKNERGRLTWRPPRKLADFSSGLLREGACEGAADVLINRQK